MGSFQMGLPHTAELKGTVAHNGGGCPCIYPYQPVSCQNQLQALNIPPKCSVRTCANIFPLHASMVSTNFPLRACMVEWHGRKSRDSQYHSLPFLAASHDLGLDAPTQECDFLSKVCAEMLEHERLNILIFHSGTSSDTCKLASMLKHEIQHCREGTP